MTTAESDGRLEVSVVIPCLNEARTLGACIDKAQQAFIRLGIRGEVVFGDNYLSPLATIKNPHRGVVKTLRRGGLVKRSEPERRSWSRSD